MTEMCVCSICWNDKGIVSAPKFLLKLWKNYRFDLHLCGKHYEELPAWIKKECEKLRE